MKKANLTTNWEAVQYIILARSIQRVHKQVAEIVDNCKKDDFAHSALVNIDNKLSEITEGLCNIIGTKVVYES
jgi:hypothetical protein